MKTKKTKKRSLAPANHPAVLTEDVASGPALLTETRLSSLTIVEQAETPEQQKRYLVRVRGEFARAGVATENGRLYPGPLWEREIQRLSPVFGQRSVFGELDHPDDGRTRLQRVSHIITDLKVEDGVVVGVAEILPTARGRDLAALIEAGCRVGVSSRGYGTTKKNSFGQDEVQEDYRLATFDFVADPADKTAYPEVFSEDVDEQALLFEGMSFDMSEEEDTDETPEADETPVAAQEEDAVGTKVEENNEQLQLEALVEARLEEERVEMEKRLRAELIPTLRESLRKEVSEQVLDEMAALRVQLEEQVRQEVLTDPTVFSEEVAKQAQENVQLKESMQELQESHEALTEQVAELEAVNEELANMARRIGFENYLERRLSGHEHADTIRELVGDVSEFSSAEEFKARVEEVEEEIAEQVRIEEEEKAERQALYERHMREKRQLEREKRQLREAAEKSIQVAQLMGVQLYAERRIARHPRADNIRSLLEQVQPTTKEEVDQIIEQFRTPVRSREEIEETAARVRKLTGGGITALASEEEEPWDRPAQRLPSEDAEPVTESRQVKGGFNGLGVPLNELRRFMPPGTDY